MTILAGVQKLCECGCGKPTRIALETSTRDGDIAGQPRRFYKGHHHRKSGAEYSVEDRGYETPCWVWLLTTSDGEHGYYRNADGSNLAHRIYYERKHGPLAAGLHLHHRCEVKACVNPDHLEPLTHLEHTRRHAKLDMEKAREIRRRHAAGESYARLAEAYGICKSNIASVVKGLTWQEAPSGN